MNDLIKAILGRRSCRKFLKKQISEAELSEIIKCGRAAPGSMNAQALHFTVLQNPEKLSELNAALRKIYKPTGKNFSFNYESPTLIIVSVDISRSVAPASDAATAIENMWLAASAIGMGAVWMHALVGKCFESGIRTILNELGVPPAYKVFGALALGYSDSTSDHKPITGNSVNFVR